MKNLLRPAMRLLDRYTTDDLYRFRQLPLKEQPPRFRVAGRVAENWMNRPLSGRRPLP
jgi:hypothetical protein